MTIEELRKEGLIILECISGSKAYGLDTPASDTDIRGVFVMPKREYYGLDYVEQINNESNDVTFYELGRFMELLSYNNPNILELLNSPEASVLYKHPMLAEIRMERILSKLCKDTFGKFAYSQIKKARGLNKKIVNPVAEQKKSVLEFCFVSHKQGSMPLLDFLEIQGRKQENYGLVSIPHMKNVYALFYDDQIKLNGIIRSEDANEVCLSSIPKGMEQLALLYYNRDGYSSYCKDYKEYWSWVDKRNEERYKSTQTHGKNYDAKNMMHVFRLLEMACEIGREGKINVRRPDRDFLLEIKSGKYEYEELLEMARLKQLEMEEAFEKSSLAELPDKDYINDLLYKFRERFYEEQSNEAH